MQTAEMNGETFGILNIFSSFKCQLIYLLYYYLFKFLTFLQKTARLLQALTKLLSKNLRPTLV